MFVTGSGMVALEILALQVQQTRFRHILPGIALGVVVALLILGFLVARPIRHASGVTPIPISYTHLTLPTT